MMESEIHPEVQKLVKYFDDKCERLLDFDKHLDNGKKLKEHLDYLIKNKNGWNKIAAACRRMIICDRELDLKKGNELIIETDGDFKGFKDTYKEQPYEAIRYANTCGLISYRRGNYSNALEYFEQAKNMAENPTYSMECFIPDTTSNLIRTEFELFFQVLPDKIEVDYNKHCNDLFITFINDYKCAIRGIFEYETDNKNGKLYWIYGHGMASLYHNLGETYDKARKTIKNLEHGGMEIPEIDLKEKAIEANECSLKWGEKIEDVYRQLQSKRALSELDEEKKDEYEKIVLGGRWQRGKQMIYQKRIKESNDSNTAQCWIDKNDFKLDKMEDKIGILYNYNAIKDFLGKGVGNVKDKDGKELNRLKIANKKIEVANKLRNEFSPLLYKRQVVKLIRDDVVYKTYVLLNGANYPEALNFSENYNNRSLVELPEFIRSGKLRLSSDQRGEIADLKDEIQKQIAATDGNKKKTINMSIILSGETNKNFLKLIFAYENVLKQPIDNSKMHKIEEAGVEDKENNKPIQTLINRLKKIPEGTAILKFFITEFKHEGKQVSLMWPFLIKEDGLTDLGKFDTCFITNIKNVIKNLENERTIEVLRDYGTLHDEMAKLSKKLELYDKLNGIKNLFIVPDGELFQLPLHLLDKEGQDLRKNVNVYYSPSLTHLLTTNENNFSDDKKKANFLWISSPSENLWDEPHLIKPNAKSEDITILEREQSKLDLFYEYYEPNKFTHVGFSAHCMFHDHLIDAYVSNIVFYDSFLTPYDILFSLDFSGVQTIFLGACSGGSCKYTDENETVGLVTAFLAKEAQSVIAPLWEITKILHNDFIELVNKSGIINSPDPWNLSAILKNSDEIESKCLIPFVQYANLELVEIL